MKPNDIVANVPQKGKHPEDRVNPENPVGVWIKDW